MTVVTKGIIPENLLDLALAKLGLLQAITSGEAECLCCGEPVARVNLGMLYRLDEKFHPVCNRMWCLSDANRMMLS